MVRKINTENSAMDSNGLDEAITHVEEIRKIIGPAQALTVKDRQRSVKLRKGGETIIPTVAALSDQFGLVVSSHPTATMRAKAKEAQDLVALHNLLITTAKNVADKIFSANSESWEAATVHYSMLRRLSRKNGDLAAALAPAKEFFGKRRAAVQSETAAGETGAAPAGTGKADADR